MSSVSTKDVPYTDWKSSNTTGEVINTLNFTYEFTNGDISYVNMTNFLFTNLVQIDYKGGNSS